MMDYYGSIIKSEREIDRELIQKFRDRCYESHMKKMINDLRRENILSKEYSVSGWLTFHGKPICNIIEKKIKKLKSEQRLKFLYIYNQKEYDEINICKMICDRI
jgi:hypothetical protein